MPRKRTPDGKVLLQVTDAVRVQAASTVAARVTLAAEAAALVDDQYVPHLLICVAALWPKPSPKTAAKFGAYGPAAVVDERDHLFTNYMEPTRDENAEAKLHTYWLVGAVPEVVDVLSGICEAAGLSDEQAQSVLDCVFKDWVKVDKLRAPATAVNISDVLHAQQFALKPGEKEKSEDERDKDGY